MPFELKVTFQRDEPIPDNHLADHQWWRVQFDSLLARYGDCFVVIFNEEVIGTGPTYQAAIENAEQNPLWQDKDVTITPVVERVSATAYNPWVTTRQTIHK